jgi:hypothetical protein
LTWKRRVADKEQNRNFWIAGDNLAMTAPRRTRTPLDFNRAELLAELGAARKAMITARRVMRPKSGLARAADAVVAEIDEFALVLTGSRDYFHASAHAALMRGDAPDKP